jgi:FAD/FMN-containing dehydrogenase
MIEHIDVGISGFLHDMPRGLSPSATSLEIGFVSQPSSSSPPLRTPRWKRRVTWCFFALLLGVVVVSGRPVWHLWRTAQRDVDDRSPLRTGYADDASRLNETPVREQWAIPADPAAAELQLAGVLRRAASEGLPVSIAGARHSMGGHTIAPDGIVIDMRPFRHLQFDAESQVLTAGAGALWSDVIPYLHARGRSVGVMQSNNSFSVGGSLSVNCHGWQFGKPPIASTVESLRVMLASGEIVHCDRTENRELFSLVLGGYGLFGVILEARLRTVPDECYRLEQYVVPTEEALVAFDAHASGRSDVGMAYARMCIVPDRFLDEVILNVLVCDPQAGAAPPLEDAGSMRLQRSLFRGSAGSDYGKELRWSAEARLQPHLQAERFWRNQLLSEGVEVFQGRSAAETDILHEYFIPRQGLILFVSDAQRIIPVRAGDLLNVTVREIERDDDTFLRYANQPMFSFVMLFNQPRDESGEARMAAMTRELIDAALDAEGRYYLPYRLHATPEQFARAYPQGAEFFALKRKHDPAEVFQNRFYQTYGRLTAEGTAGP